MKGGIMETDKNAFRSLLEIFLEQNHIKNNENNYILFFQGFPISFYNFFKENSINHFSGSWNGRYPDVNSLSGVNMLSKFISAKGVNWGFYEELIALSEILTDFSAYKGEILVVKNSIFETYYPIPIKDRDRLISLIDDENNANIDSKILNYYSDYKIESENILVSYVNKHFKLDIGTDINECGLYDVIIPKKTNSCVEDFVEISVTKLTDIKRKLQNGSISNKRFRLLGDNTTILEKNLDALNTLGVYYNVEFQLGAKHDHEILKGEDYLQILHRYWGEDKDFRKLKMYKNPAIENETINISQGTIISDIIKQCNSALSETGSQYSDIIVTAPTGSGKSVFFQITGIYLEEHTEYKALTIVICPLVALMIDQVKELNERGINYATYINSALTYEERQARFEGIKSGRYSIVYMSPELLLAYDIDFLIGDRRIGLLVIDEAHLVTSWGRDFRVDYWFLGDYIEKIRRGSYYMKKKEVNFPVLCLTATAVYNGRDDVIGDLQNSLHLTCYSDHIYIGYVKRDNIQFKIRHPKKERRSDKEEKLNLTASAVSKFVENKNKTIVYFPYKSQIEDVRNMLLSEYSDILPKVEKYYSGEMKSMEKDEAYSNFREGESLVMLATKAFGMGVNISDVVNVYHYAPTGTLADYVQEIGRAARQLEVGFAITDYLKSDMHYAQTLWGLSGLRHYQIKAIIKKLYSIYAEKQRRNLLFSPETFSYLFDAKSIDMKVKSGLMLLSADLLEKYHFKVIAVRPKNLFSRQYIIVPTEIESEFLGKYGTYCERMKDNYTQKELAYGYNSEVSITKTGDIFEIDLGLIWEKKFYDITFAQFKYKFFSGELFDYDKFNVVPNIKLIITYEKGYSEIEESFKRLSIAIQTTFNDIKRNFGGKNFTSNNFVNTFRKYYDNKVRREYIIMLLEMFCYNHVDSYEISSEPWKFIELRKAETEKLVKDTVYCIRTQKYAHISANLQRYFKQAKPNTSDNRKYISYLSIPKKGTKQSYQQLMASVLQLFDFASYEFIGGRNPQIFVRINDPMKLRRIAESNQVYKNQILRDIEERHKRAVKIMNHFMQLDYSNEERWDIIEDYFLGNDIIIDSKLGITEDISINRIKEVKNVKKQKFKGEIKKE